MNITENRKARFNYEILDTIECGIVLVGSELKPLRDKKASLAESYAKIKNGEFYLMQASIQCYATSTHFNHDEARERKLLIHKNELVRLEKQLDEKHLSAFPLKMYFNDRGHVKVLIGVGRGKKTTDKRDTIKKREQDREMKRQIK
jgi:SsrA-binding protein